MLVQKLIIKAVAALLKKQFKLDKILKYVEQPNELDEEVKILRNKVEILELLLLKKEK